jgi:hypothetical protein
VAQVAVSEEDEAVEALVANGLDEALGEGINVGRLGRQLLHLPTLAADDLVESPSLKKLSPFCHQQEKSPVNRGW